jgi:CO dehydrogenase maturation factor
MKIGVVGKGGVGKTTVAALLARAFCERGASVVAIDTDSNPNLGLSLGLTSEQADALPTLPRSALLGGDGASAASLLEEYGRATPFGVTLLTAMRVEQAGGGCTCGGHANVRSLLGDALGPWADVTVVDMEAGLEHLSRAGGTLAHADVLLVVMEPSRKSLITASRTATLAEELGLERVYGLGNKARLPGDAAFFERGAAEHRVPLAGIIPYDPAVAEADRAGGPVEPPEPVRAELARVVAFVEQVVT